MKIGGCAHPQRLFQLGRISGAGGLERNYVNKNIDRCSKTRFRTNFEAKLFFNFVIVGRGLHPNFPNMRQIMQIFSKKTRFYRELPFSIYWKKKKQRNPVSTIFAKRQIKHWKGEWLQDTGWFRQFSSGSEHYVQYWWKMSLFERAADCARRSDFVLTGSWWIFVDKQSLYTFSSRIRLRAFKQTATNSMKMAESCIDSKSFALLRDMQQFVNQFSQIRMTVTRIHCLLTRDRILGKEFFFKPLVVVLCGKLNGQQEKNQCGKTNCCREHRIENRRKNECGCFSLFKVGEWKHRHHTSLPLLLANNNANEKQTPRRPLK